MKIKENVTIFTSDFWYDLFQGGYIKPEEILENESDIEDVKNAIKVILDFKMSTRSITEYE